ncbi:hypothetical protein BcepF1.113 [Burkholderia phage BcepF1]|uniref:Uncharacterized protein n=1 Tax=Burkholderia phage BcepF1 TaxID=2886897 RepID=A1Z017_9CAUD|nr:hypothetical protein BcepF1.113 [Burkholderia phage BcepF1]ABL96844.1 hypothetical protein BcepF1.113 [Burkholderia phage BcepF1]
MTDLELIDTVVPYIEAAIASQGWPFLVVQKDQPTQQGVPSIGTVFFELLFNIEYGSPATENQYNAASNQFDEIETQLVITTIQISALIPQDPKNIDQPTANDVLQYVKRYVASRNIARELVKKKVNIYRVSEVRAQWFEDDNHQFSNHPNFDLEVTHSGKVTFSVAAVDRCDPLEVPPYGSGTFPV